MTLALPPDWPACGAENTDRRRRATRCRARGDGWGQRCRHHGGLDIPDGPHAVVCSPAGFFIWRTRRGALDPLETARQRVSWRIALSLVETGRIRFGFFFGRKGGSLLRHIEAAGVLVLRISRGAPTALSLTRYTFHRKAMAA